MENRRRTFTAKNIIFMSLTAAFIAAAAFCTLLVNYSEKRRAVGEAKEKAWIIFELNRARFVQPRDSARAASPGVSSETSAEASTASGIPSPSVCSDVTIEGHDASGRTTFRYRSCIIRAGESRDGADPYEAELMRRFMARPELNELNAVRNFDGEPWLIVMRRDFNLAPEQRHPAHEGAPGGPAPSPDVNGDIEDSHVESPSALAVRISLAESFHAADQFSMQLSLVFTSILFGLFLFLTVLGNRLIFKPLAIMRAKAAQISASPDDHLGEEIPLPSTSELHGLTASFNAMSTALRAEKNLMEERVMLRTCELQAATEALELEVAERKRSGEALRESEARWQFAIEGAGDGVWDWNLETGELFFSRQWKATLGFGEHEIRDSFAEWENRVHPEDLARTWEDIRSHMEGRTPVYINEHRMRCKDGSYIWILARGKVIQRTKEGEPQRMIGAHMDVTERRQAEVALQVSEKRLRRAEVVARFGNWEFDLARDQVKASEGARIIYGAGDRAWSITEVKKIALPEYRPFLDEAMARLIREGEPYNVEFKIRRPSDGAIVDIHSIAEYSPEEGVVFGVIQDITDRRRAEEEARIQRETLVKVFEGAPYVMMLVDMRGRIADINRAGAAFAGKPKGELIGLLCGQVLNCRNAYDGPGCGMNAACERCPVCTRVKLTFETGESIYGAEGRMTIRRGSTEVDVDMMISTALVKAGKTHTVFVAINDITEHKRAEEERLEMERSLQQTQKLESLGVLAGGIAHDFNNLLMVILGHADLAMHKLSPMSPARESLRQIEKASRRAADLCRQMLAYSGKQQFQLERVDLKELVEEMAHLLKTSISKKAILHMELEDGLPHIRADATQIRQVVMNLIINASEAIGEQNGAISIRIGAVLCDSNRLSDMRNNGSLQPGLYACMEVADTGCGMDAETLQRIFEPFFTTKFTGRGLGMAAALGIVRAHEGALELESQPGRGTTFRAFFPAGADGGKEEGPATLSSEPLRQGSGLILVADDEEAVLNVGQAMLERLGFSTLVARDGLEALELYRERGGEIDLVLLDMTMPRMDGAEAFSELRRIDPKVRVIISSGHAEGDIISKFSAEEISGFIQKPYTLENLQAALRCVESDPSQAASTK